MNYQSFPHPQKTKPGLITLAAISFFMIITGYACQNVKNNKPMNEQELHTQPADSGRLLTVANAEATDSGRKVTAWFFETPQIFEFALADEAAQNMFRLLKEAKEKQLPVNVYSTTVKGRNTINKIGAATEAQLELYKKIRPCGNSLQPYLRREINKKS